MLLAALAAVYIAALPPGVLLALYVPDSPDALLQPLNMPFLLQPVEVASVTRSWLALMCGSAFALLFVRSLGGGYIAGVLSAITYTFGGGSLAALGSGNDWVVLAWAPGLFWCFHEYARRGRWSLCVLAGLMGAMLLGAEDWRAAVTALLLVLMYFLIAVLRHEGVGRRRKMLLGLGLSVVIALAVGAPQFFVALPLKAGSSRIGNSENETVETRSLETGGAARAALGAGADAPLPLWRQLILGQRQPGTPPFYYGAAALLLLPAVFFRKGARIDAVFFFVLAGLAAGLYATGMLSSWQGGLAGVAFPFGFGIAVLTGLGLDALLRPVKMLQRPGTVFVIASVVLVAVVLLMTAPAPFAGRVVALLAAWAPFVILRARWIAPPTALLAALVAFADLTTAAATGGASGNSGPLPTTFLSAAPMSAPLAFDLAYGTGLTVSCVLLLVGFVVLFRAESSGGESNATARFSSDS